MQKTVLLVLLAAMVAGCTVGATDTPAPPTADATGGVAILFQRSGGIVSNDLQWALYPDGRLITGKGEERALPAGQVEALLTEIERLGFWELQDSYGLAVTCNDCYTYRITVNDGGKVKTVVAVEGAADTPGTVLEIVDAINALLASRP